MPTKPSYHPQTRSTIPPNSAPGATRLRRFTFRPYDKRADDGTLTRGVSFGLSLYDTGTPSPNGAPFLGFRLYQHTPGARRGVVLFEAANWAPESSPLDVTAEAVRLVNFLTTRPGEPGDEALAAWVPAQLEFALAHAGALRAEARRRLAWSLPEHTHFRLTLDVVQEARADLRALARYRTRFGVLEADGHTQHEARAALAQAAARHCSMLPGIFVGERTATVYVLYPHGAEFVLQPVNPTMPADPLETPARFTAGNPSDAVTAARKAIARLEAPPPPQALPRAWQRPGPKATATPVTRPARHRASARAGATSLEAALR